MLARCARCQGTFTTDRFGRQFCPHCGSELILADPNAPQPPPAAPASDGSFAPPPPPGAPPEPPPPAGAGWSPPPPPGPGWSPPPPSPPGGPGNPAGPGGPGGPNGPDAGPGLPSPFAERRTRGFFRSFFDTWKLAALEPQRFFAHVRIDQVGTAVLFGLIAALAGGAVAALLGIVGNASSMAMIEQAMGKMPPEEAEFLHRILPYFVGGVGVAVQLAFLPVSILLRMFLGAAVVHLVLLVLGGAKRGFGATLTVTAFSMGVHLLAAVPGCGTLIAGVWQLVVVIIGLAAIHRTDVWRAAVAVLAPVVLCCCCVGLSIGSLVMAFAGSAASGGGGTNL